MVKRRSRKAKPRKAARRPTRRKTARRKVARKMSDSRQQTVEKNRKAHWAVYRELQKKASKALAKLRSDANRRVSPEVLLQDRNNLLLLLGECNYLASECMRIKGRWR